MLHLIALRNVKVHWKQSFAAFLSIGTAFLCFVLFQGYILDVAELYADGYRNRSMYGDAIIQNRLATSTESQKNEFEFELTAQDQLQIQSVLDKHASEIFAQVRFLTFQGLIATGTATKIFVASAHDVEPGTKMRENWKYNVLVGDAFFQTKIENPVHLGKTLGFQLGCEPDSDNYQTLPQGGYPPETRPFHCRRSDLQLSVTTQLGQLNAIDATVVGLVDAGYKDVDSRFIAVPLPLAQKLLATDHLSYETVKLNPGIDAKKWIQTLAQELTAADPKIAILDWKDHPAGDLYRQTMSLLNIFRTFVTIVVALISILSVTNTMVKIIKERTREIGTLLSLGFQRHQVLRIFLYEAGFIGISSCLAGALVTLVASWLLNHANVTYKAGLLSEPAPFRVQIDLGTYVLASVLLIAIATLSSYWSCRSTLRKKIVDCLGDL